MNKRNQTNRKATRKPKPLGNPTIHNHINIQVVQPKAIEKKPSLFGFLGKLFS